MKRFMIFCGSDYYPSGGMHDFLSDHDTLDEAKDALLVHAFEGSVDWAHVHDTEENKTIYIGRVEK